MWSPLLSKCSLDTRLFSLIFDASPSPRSAPKIAARVLNGRRKKSYFRAEPRLFFTVSSAMFCEESTTYVRHASGVWW